MWTVLVFTPLSLSPSGQSEFSVTRQSSFPPSLPHHSMQSFISFLKDDYDLLMLLLGGLMQPGQAVTFLRTTAARNINTNEFG